MILFRAYQILVYQLRWMLKTLCLSCTPLALPGSQKEWFTVVGGIWFIQHTPFSTYFNTKKMIFIGVPQTLVGLQDIATWFTGHWLVVQPVFIMKEFPLTQSGIVFGRSVKNIRSTNFIPHQPLFVPLRNTLLS